MLLGKILFWIQLMGSSNSKNQEQLLPTKFVPPYAWIFMDEVDTELLQKSGKTNYLLAPWYWQYIFRTVLLSFCMNFHPNLNFTYETFYCNVNCLDLNINLRNGAIHRDLFTLNQPTLHKNWIFSSKVQLQ